MLDVLQLAGSLPKNPRFREWVEAQHFNTWRMTEDDLAWLIRSVCEVKSRRDLATNPAAARRFHELIRKPFLAYCEQLESTA